MISGIIITKDNIIKAQIIKKKKTNKRFLKNPKEKTRSKKNKIERQ